MATKRICGVCGIDIPGREFCPYCNGQEPGPSPVRKVQNRSRLWILGAPDPEMQMIESLLRDAGEVVAYATVAGVRCHPGNAYRAEAAGDVTFPAFGEVVLVECSFHSTHPYQPGRVQEYADPLAGGPVFFPSSGLEEFVREITVSRIDHHRPGDPGYGRGPDEFLPASSLGQAWAVLHDEPMFRGGRWTDGAYIAPPGMSPMTSDGDFAPDEEWMVSIPGAVVLCAAADHCLEAAYRGKCPGVDPEELMRWRVESRAAFQRRSAEDVMLDVFRARTILTSAVEAWTCPECGGSGLDQYSGTETCQYCGGDGHGGPYPVARLDGRATISELPEAAAREGIPFLSSVVDRDGREKVVLQAASPELVRAFLAGEMGCFRALDGRVVARLSDVYGDPARGFAGGYVS